MKRHAFTLVELLVVIAIIGVLIALLLPAVQAAREAARRMQCSNQIKQHLLGLHNYHDTNSGFPNDGWRFAVTGGNIYNIGYIVRILPFMELSNVYDSMDVVMQQNADRTTKNKAAAKDVKLAGSLCPSSNGLWVTNLQPTIFGTDEQYTFHYYGVTGAVGPVPGTSPAVNYDSISNAGLGFTGKNGTITFDVTNTFSTITDGTSNTFGLGEISWGDERNKNYGHWHRGAVVTSSGTSLYYTSSARAVASDNPLNTRTPHRYTTSDGLSNYGAFGSDHPVGTHFGVMDGSVRFISQTVNMDTIKELATVDGGESRTIP